MKILIRHIAQLGRYVFPFYPLFNAYASIKHTISTGMYTWRNLNEHPHPPVLTFRQAMARRPVDAISIEAIERRCLTRKRVALAGVFLCLCFSFGSVLGENKMGVLLGASFGVLSASFCFVSVVKYDHRLWQIEVGQQNPDQALGSFRTFFAAPGIFLRLLNPRFQQGFSNDIHR